MTDEMKKPYKKVQVSAQLRLDAYGIIMDRIETELRYGWNRAHKHTDKPDMEAILQAQHDAISGGLSDLMNKS